LEFDISDGSLLGTGKFGKVYKCVYGGRDVAIKLIYYRNKYKKKNWVDILKNEIEIASNLSQHERIVEYIGSIYKDSSVYIISELCKGDLHSIGNIDNSTFERYCKEIAEGMNYLHSNFVIHRDLTPNNILMSKDDHIKITDFGLSKIVKKISFCDMTSKIGSIKYMAPEVYNDKSYSFKSDVYSYAFVCYFIRTKKENNCLDTKLKDEKKAVKQFFKKVDEGYRPDLGSLLTISDKMKNLISKCWSTNQESRPSFAEILISIEKND